MYYKGESLGHLSLDILCTGLCHQTYFVQDCVPLLIENLTKVIQYNTLVSPSKLSSIHYGKYFTHVSNVKTKDMHLCHVKKDYAFILFVMRLSNSSSYKSYYADILFILQLNIKYHISKTESSFNNILSNIWIS